MGGRDRLRGRSSWLTRRQLLAGAGGLTLAGVTGVVETGALTSVTAERTTTVGVADDPNAVVGLTVYSPVRKNKTEPMLAIENGFAEQATVSVTLAACADGTLEDPETDAGCSVSFPLASGGTGTVSLTANRTGTIPFTVDVQTSSVSVSATRSVGSQAGNQHGAVRINKVQNFTANATGNRNDFGVKQVQIQDKDNDDDLDRVEYEITDSNGTLIASLTHDGTQVPGDQYQVHDLTIQPNGGQTVQSGETYSLTVTGYDADGNYDTATRTTTA